MANIKGRNVRVEIAATFGTPITITAVTNANPAVASTTTPPVANVVGYFSSVEGMAQLEGQACRVKAPSAGTFQLQGFNTTTFPAFTDSAQFTPVATWVTLAESTSYSISGGAGEKLDVTRLIDTIKQEEQGLLPAANVGMNVLAQDAPTAAMLLIEDAVQTQIPLVMRITFANGAVRVFRGDPSQPGEDVQQGQIGTGSLDFAVKGLVLKLAA